jgi:hypothetical protein
VIALERAYGRARKSAEVSRRITSGKIFEIDELQLKSDDRCAA